jgi:hypothetical protein
LEKEDYVQLFQMMGNHLVIGGDYDAKNTVWGSRLNTPKGKELYEGIKEMNCEVQSTGKPTYWPTNKKKIPSLIDFFVLKGTSASYISIEENHNLASDHTCIVLTLSESVITKQ